MVDEPASGDSPRIAFWLKDSQLSICEERPGWAAIGLQITNFGKLCEQSSTTPFAQAKQAAEKFVVFGGAAFKLLDVFLQTHAEQVSFTNTDKLWTGRIDARSLPRSKVEDFVAPDGTKTWIEFRIDPSVEPFAITAISVAYDGFPLNANAVLKLDRIRFPIDGEGIQIPDVSVPLRQVTVEQLEDINDSLLYPWRTRVRK
ncbi:hypothetical protein [Planctomicrobium piriforme]|nr:hypothetical protein [Planctomicrobium piriforme]